MFSQREQTPCYLPSPKSTPCSIYKDFLIKPTQRINIDTYSVIFSNYFSSFLSKFECYILVRICGEIKFRWAIILRIIKLVIKLIKHKSNTAYNEKAIKSK